jgi:hypothetical protein
LLSFGGFIWYLISEFLFASLFDCGSIIRKRNPKKINEHWVSYVQPLLQEMISLHRSFIRSVYNVSR